LGNEIERSGFLSPQAFVVSVTNLFPFIILFLGTFSIFNGIRIFTADLLIVFSY